MHSDLPTNLVTILLDGDFANLITLLNQQENNVMLSYKYRIGTA